ncbi:MAG: hypothetical protein HYS53_00190 [Candidatus Aenigmarchaeota archaeon]|nr:hypothetical protein [Candidatus Aenigmarchaeota archaeon]
MPYKTGAENAPTISVLLRPTFMQNWRKGHYKHDPAAFAAHFNMALRSGYLGLREEQTDSLYVLRFDGRKLVVPVRRNGSPFSMEASAFYHEKQKFQLGRKNMEPAEISDATVKPGAISVLWKAWEVMY